MDFLVQPLNDSFTFIKTKNSHGKLRITGKQVLVIMEDNEKGYWRNIKHYDVVTSYLNGNLSHEVYTKQPEGY